MKNLVDGGMKDGAIAGLENGGWMVAASGSSVIIKLSKIPTLLCQFRARKRIYKLLASLYILNKILLLISDLQT